MSIALDATSLREFFVAGGTLPLHSESYLERGADDAIIKALLDGRFCYVLNSRQMGKSSLCVRTMARLQDTGVHCAFVDITKIGGRNVTPEQWYAGLIVEIGRSLNLKDELLSYWKAESHLSPMQRFFGSLHDVGLCKLEGKIVIFVDEIDSTRSLPFSTDEFFAGVRECFNRRVQEPAYERLTFCFLGVAVPSDLIHDARTTPFNIGERIYLKDFTLEEIVRLGSKLGPNGERLLRRIFYWTNGHPFLTQSLCRAIAGNQAVTTEKDVDEIIHHDLLEPKVRETNINLSDVGNRVLNGYADDDDIAKFRADILSAYAKALAGKETLPDDESNRITAVLKLSGLMRSEGKTLKVRNRIYEKAFDKAWIRENMPGQELRRQRRAFLLGAARTALGAAAIIGIISYLAIANKSLANRMTALATEKSYQTYVATMQLMPVIYGQRNLTRMHRMLTEHADEPWKGIEWNYWDRMSHQSIAESPYLGYDAAFVSLSPDQKLFVTCTAGEARFIDAGDAHVVRTFKVQEQDIAIWMRDGKRLLACTQNGAARLISADDGRELSKLPESLNVNPYSLRDAEGRYVSGFDRRTGNWARYDFKTRELQDFKPGLVRPAFSPDGSMIAVSDGNLILLDASTFEAKRTLKLALPAQVSRYAFVPQTREILVGSDGGHVLLYDYAADKVEWDIQVANSLIADIAISADGKVAAFTPRDRRTIVYEVGAKNHIFVREIPEANMATFVSNSRIATSYTSLALYDIKQPGPITVAALPKATEGYRLRKLNGDMLTVSTGNHELYEAVDGNLVHRLHSAVRSVPAAANAANAYWRLDVKDGHASLSDFMANKEILTLGPITQIPSIERVGELAMVCLDGSTIQIWNVQSKQKVRELKWPSTVAGISSDEAGKQVVVINSQNRLALVDPSTWTVRWDNGPKAIGHVQALRGGHFSKDGTLIVTASDDDTAMLWDAKTGERLATFVGHAQTVVDADISQDKTRVATASEDGTVRLWDAKTGLEVTTLGSTGTGEQMCAFTRDGKYLMTGDLAARIKFWPISPRR